MITEPEVNFRGNSERLLRVCWATIWVGSTGDCATAVTATSCNSNRNHRSDDQRAAISHGRLHLLALQQAMGGASLGM